MTLTPISYLLLSSPSWVGLAAGWPENRQVGHEKSHFNKTLYQTITDIPYSMTKCSHFLTITAYFKASTDNSIFLLIS